MPRLRQVPKSEAIAPIVTMMYEYLFDDRDPVQSPGTAAGTPGDWWTVFALVPDVMDHAVKGFGLYQSPDRQLDPVLRELGQARAGWATGSQFVYSQHCKSLRHLGVTEERIESVPGWAAADCYSAVERHVLAYADCLALDRGRVPDQLFDALHAELGDAQVLELTYITSLYVMHAIMSRALRTEFDDRPEPVVEVAAPEGAEARDIGADISGGQP
jgi:alkylhydroperoxidase family enzyme